MSRGTSKKSTGTILLLRTKNLSYLYPNNLVREAGFEPVEPISAKTTDEPKRLKLNLQISSRLKDQGLTQISMYEKLSRYNRIKIKKI